MSDPVAGVALISDRTWSGIATICRIAGALGAAGLVFLVVFSLWTAHEADRGTDCIGAQIRNVDASATDPGVRIIGLQPAMLQLNHSLCVQVDDVVTPARQAELLANVTIAAHQLAMAGTAVKVAVKTSGAAPTEQSQAEAKVADATQTKAKADLASAQSAFDEGQKGRTMILYLNGKASPLTAVARPVATAQTLAFEIAAPEDANSAEAAYWRALLAGPTSKGRLPLRIGVAEQGAPAPVTNLASVDGPNVNGSNVNGSNRDKSDLTFVLYTPWLMYSAAVAVGAIVLGLFGLAYDTTLLRDGSTTANAYSLSLVQMAVWLVLTTTGFVYIWLVTGQYQNVFSSSLFVLVGIAGTTAAAAQTMNRGAAKPKSAGFFRDIAGAWQGGEVQLQRLQIIAWTVILALIFFWNVLGRLTLTSFDANLLVLTGIANGVYVSLKPQETK